MSKQVISNYEFDATAGTITFPDFDEPMDQSRLALVTNTSKGVLLYNFMDPTLRGEMNGNVLTLEADTSGMEGDTIRIDYDTAFGDIGYDRTIVGNARSKFRDGFATTGITQPNPDTWVLQEDTPGRHIINQGGDSSGASYLRISLDPFTEGDGLTITSKSTFRFPKRVGFGISISQRISGQEVFIGMVGADPDGSVPTIDPVPDKPITGATASVTSNVATFTVAGHGFKGGDRINIIDCADHRMNAGPLVVTVVTADTFTVPITISNGSYSTVGGSIRTVDPLRYARNGAGLLFENTTTTNGSFVARRNGAKFRSTNYTVATTTASQTNTNPYTDAFNSAGNQELYFSMEEVSFRSFASDSTAGMNGLAKYTQGVPDEELPYKIHIRARTLQGFTRPVARVVTAAKSGTTTATITTDVPHNLAVGDFVQIYGTRDQTNFANLSTMTAIASVPSATTFTLVWGSAVTATTVNGVVWVNHGMVAAPGVFGQAVQSISRTNGVLTLNGNATWATPLPGEYVQVHGLDSAAAEYEGAYKVLRVSGTVLEVDAPGPNFSSITTGGAVFRRTDVRLHFTRVMDYTRHVVEVVGGRGNSSDANNSVAVTLAASPSVSQTTGVNTTQWSAAGWGGFLVADHASAALTSTSTGGAVTPGTVANIGQYSFSVHIPVTAVSGTNPTMDVAIEESPDNGTTWVRIYEFQRITATGNYYSPLLRATWGTRLRYIRTIGGTSPSFTNAVNRLMFSAPGELIRQFFDRTINPTTLNSTTPAYTVDGCNSIQTTVSLGAATTPPNLLLQGSEDGGSWYNIGATWTPAANTQTKDVQLNVAFPKFVRVLVQTAGSAVTLNWVSVKAMRI
jgi:hypothetical protein